MTGIAFEAEFAGSHGFADGGADIQVERLAQGAGLLGAVEDGDALDGFGQRLDEGVQREGTIEVDLDHADLLTLFDQVLDGLLNGVGAGAHDDDDPLGIFGADIVDQLVLAAGELAEFVHFFLDDLDAGLVELVDGFTALEVDVRVLGGAAHDGTVGGEAAQAVGVDQLVVHHGAHVVKGQLFDLLDFVRGAETVEEVQERDPAERRVAAWAIRAKSMTSWTLLEQNMAQPVERQDMTSEWSPKMFRAPGRRWHGRRHGRPWRSARRRSCTCWGSSAADPGWR